VNWPPDAGTRGFRVVVTARKPEQVEALAAKGEALVLKLDVTDPSPD
jgi:NADP-dependent 3-hydroxy acid dehydrogenase YdfG